MNLIQKSIFALSAITSLSSSLDSHHPFLIGVDGAIENWYEVRCHPEDPKVCQGVRYAWTPSPAIHCPDPPSEETCAPVYQGGWGWKYDYVKGLKEGIEDYDAINAATTGLEVTVTLDDDETTCKVEIGDEDCSMCSKCDDYHEGYWRHVGVKFDCTNLKKGTAFLDKCVDVGKFFHPLKKRGMKKKNINTRRMHMSMNMRMYAKNMNTRKRM